MPVYILPVSHIARESRLNVAKAFHEISPEIVAVELDIQRLEYLLAPENFKRPGFSLSNLKEQVLTFLLSAVQKFFGQKTGEKPGEEFLVGVGLAAQRSLPIALVDRPIGQTIERFSSEVKLKTVLKLARLAVFPKKSEQFSIDLNSVPSERTIRRLLFYMKREFPGIYRAIVSERDEVISKNILSMPSEKKVLLLVGAAHVPGLLKRIPGATVL